MIFDDEGALRFDLDRRSRFFFKCRRCNACCNNKRISPSAPEIKRMARGLGVPAGEFSKRYLEGADRILRLQPNGDCVFLTFRGCGIHPDRPLICRLFPLGLIWSDSREERFGLMPRHPDCLGYVGDEDTVEGFLRSEGVKLFPDPGTS